MILKFKGNVEPCIVYSILSGPVPEYDELMEKYCMCYEVPILGFVSVDRFEPATEHPGNNSIVDVAIRLTNNS